VGCPRRMAGAKRIDSSTSPVYARAVSWLLLAVSVPPTLFAVALLVAVVVTARRIPKLVRESGPPPRARLSIITPACNEETEIGSAMASLLALDWPDLEVIAVDDRSTDRTGAILDAIAAKDGRLRVHSITELPPGWLGKVHALHRGTERATGAWLLFTDADVHYTPNALRVILSYAEANGLDFVTALPRVESAGFWGDVTLAATLPLAGLARPWKVREPDSAVYAGLGAFIVVRREAFAKTEGFPWLRLEVADDMGLGLLLKRDGARCAVVDGTELLSLVWYSSLGDLALKTQKNFWAILARFSIVRAIALTFLCWLVAALPVLALASWAVGDWGVLALVPFVGTLCLVSAAAVWGNMSRRPIGPNLFAPLGFAVLGALILRAAVLGHRMGGIRWRGVRYESEELRAHQRVLF
jgi:cellulose synthase/poly-beta-1,6-N-acetylglucosamine synthase-like glycosyltransferase